jgi:macrolide transport system ATP-binding/permease protein
MLCANQIRKSFGASVILDGVTLHLSPGDRTGLVGPNGCGKTTLLRILAGIDSPDSGSVQSGAGDRIGYLPQGLVLPEEETLGEFLTRVQGDLPVLSAEVERLAAALGPDAAGRGCARRFHGAGAVDARPGAQRTPDCAG